MEVVSLCRIAKNHGDVAMRFKCFVFSNDFRIISNKYQCSLVSRMINLVTVISKSIGYMYLEREI